MQLQIFTVSTKVNSFEDDAWTKINAAKTIVIVKMVLIWNFTNGNLDRTTDIHVCKGSILVNALIKCYPYGS